MVLAQTLLISASRLVLWRSRGHCDINTCIRPIMAEIQRMLIIMMLLQSIRLAYAAVGFGGKGGGIESESGVGTASVISCTSCSSDVSLVYKVQLCIPC